MRSPGAIRRRAVRRSASCGPASARWPPRWTSCASAPARASASSTCWSGSWRRSGGRRRYAEGIEAPPGRLDEVEARLAALERLKRKHGGTVAAVLAHAEACRARRAELAGAEEAIEAAEADLSAVRAELAAAS